VSDFSVTVSSNEAQQSLIQKPLTQQAVTAMSPAGSHLPTTVSLLPQRLAKRAKRIHPPDQAQ
jgi:hypothetical protein